MANAQRLPLAPVTQPREETKRRHLRPVTTAPEVAPRQGMLMLVLIAIAAVLGIFVTQLWLSVAISKGAYMANDLILEERELARTERVMQQEVYLYSSPQHLAQRAADQGMVQNSRPAFLALDGATIRGELTQQSSAARVNTIANAALQEFTTPEAEKQKAERAAAAEKRAAAEKAEAEKSAQAVEPQSVKPAGPVTWSGALPVPETH